MSNVFHAMNLKPGQRVVQHSGVHTVLAVEETARGRISVQLITAKGVKWTTSYSALDHVLLAK
jgi:preprotein translocase subunit YajC